ncbi:MAG: mevalonate kinase [Saprospiraceae bacterium]
MKHYASKLLLFGEHIVVIGARALAIPYPAFQGHWTFGPADASLQQSLPDFLSYLKTIDLEGLAFDLTAFERDLSMGLFFESNIPLGYGLGSSGALCAAVYDRYALSKIRRAEADRFDVLQRQLARMEGFFHASSSGVDPLICYVEKALLIQAGQRPAIVTFADKDMPANFFLLDTGISRKTGPLVALFLKKYAEKTFQLAVQQTLVPANEAAIEAILSGDKDGLWQHFRAISYFQKAHFSEMIPPAYRSLWQKGLDQGDFTLKLCGAGGGGFLFGLAKDAKIIADLQATHSLYPKSKQPGW